MVDKVKPLKFESPDNGGTQTDIYPTEASPSADYLAGKGFAFENLDSHLIDKVGGMISAKYPTQFTTAVFNGNGSLNYIEYYSVSSFPTTARLAKVNLTYDTNISPTAETHLIYDSSGTAVVRTFTNTYTFSGVDLTNSKTEII